jgi:uncharacterized protein
MYALPERCGSLSSAQEQGAQGMLADGEIRRLFQRAQTIAIIGMSADPNRDSYGVARFLQRNGYRIVPVNPNLNEPVLGEQPYRSLAEIPFPIDIVDIFRRSEYVPEVVEQALAIHANMVVWMQLGVVHQIAAKRAESAGLGVVMNRCTAIEHRRLMRVPEGMLV